jgi:hypothetical protein
VKRRVVRLHRSTEMESNSQLSIELVWEDDDLEELLILASNGRYSGLARVYFGKGDIKDLAERIRGFPLALSHQLIFSAGNEESDSFAKLVFQCIDGVGRTMVRVSLAEAFQQDRAPTIKGHVELDLLFEPVALDQFARELDQMAIRRSSRAVLRGTDAQQALGADSS